MFNEGENEVFSYHCPIEKDWSVAIHLLNVGSSVCRKKIKDTIGYEFLKYISELEFTYMKSF